MVFIESQEMTQQKGGFVGEHGTDRGRKGISVLKGISPPKLSAIYFGFLGTPRVFTGGGENLPC